MGITVGGRLTRRLRSGPRQVVELLPPSIGLPLRAWKNYAWVHGLHAAVPALWRLIPPGRDAVDAGANRGIYAYWIARRASHVHAFEPLPHASTYLRRAKVPNITVYDVALSDTDGSGVLRVPAVDGESSLGSHVDPDGATLVPVTLARLDGFGLDDIGFMKIDVEGHELQVLHGAEQTIRASRPNLLVEVEQRYQQEPITAAFDYITQSLGYACAYTWRRGRLAPLADFEISRDQVARVGDRLGRYVNNFVFSDTPLT